MSCLFWVTMCSAKISTAMEKGKIGIGDTKQTLPQALTRWKQSKIGFMQGKSRYSAQQLLCESCQDCVPLDTETREAQRTARLQSLEELRKASHKCEFETGPNRMGGTLTIDGEEGYTKKTCQSCGESSRNEIHEPMKMFEQRERGRCATPGCS